MQAPERIFANRKIVAKNNTLPPNEIKLFSFEKRELQLNKRRMEEIVKAAEGWLDYEFKIIPLSAYRRYYIDGNRSEMQANYFPRRSALLKLALAEMYERKGRFTNKLIDVIWAILEESTWLLSAHFRHAIGSEDGVPNYFGDVRMHDVALFAASTGALLSLVYKYCKDILDEVSPVICERIKYEVTLRIIKPCANKTFHWMGHDRPQKSNWLTWITSNVLYVVSVFGDDRAIREHLVQKCLGSLDTYFASYSPDGGCDEGPSYWTAAGGSLLDCLDILYDISGGKINIYDHPTIKAMGEYAVHFNIFDTNVVNFADSGKSVTLNAALIRRFGEAVGSEDMLAFSKLLNKMKNPDLSESHAYRILRTLYEPDVEGDVPSLPANPAVYYEYLKVALLRESGVRGEGIFLGMKGGHNAEDHNHNDVGSFMLYRDKTPIIVDLGPGEYINWNFWNRDNNWHKDSDFHSLPIFDGIIQKTGKAYASSDEIFSAEEKSFSLQLKSAYPAEAGIVSFVRHAQIKDGGAVITDDISLDTEREIDFAFTSPIEPKIEGDAFILNGGAKLSCNMPAELSVIAHDTSKIKCVTWGETAYTVHFKVKSKGGKFVFTIK